MSELEKKIDHEGQESGGVFTNAVDALLAKVESAVEDDGEVFRLIVDGETLCFRRPTSMSHIRGFQKAGVLFVAKMADPDEVKKMPSKLRKALEGREPEDLVTAFVIHYWSAEPSKFTQEQALKLTRAPALADRLVTAVNKEFDLGLDLTIRRSIEEKKDDSQDHYGSEPGSRRPRKSSQGSRSQSSRASKTSTSNPV